jgi:hypothetical protein
MANSFVGTWNTVWKGGSHTAGQVTITDDGNGSYPNGTLQGQFSAGNLSYSGTWSDSNQSGPFTFVLVGTDTFIGVWGLDGNPGGQWNGTVDR